MNLVIDGIPVDISIRFGEQGQYFRQQVMEYLEAGKPFVIYRKEREGVIILPQQMITYDLPSKQAMQHKDLDAFQWTISCAVTVYDKVGPLTNAYALELLNHAKQLNEPKKQIE